MHSIAATLVIFAELTYYLLIAQTGIVEYLHSDIYSVAPLPLGGIVGSLGVAFLPLGLRGKLLLVLAVQTGMSLFYPEFNAAGLFVLGLGVGGAAPLVVMLSGRVKSGYIAAALIASYAVGTLLFNGIAPMHRMPLGVALAALGFGAALFIKPVASLTQPVKTSAHSLLLMATWVFLDSALFETLSREPEIAIWRGGYTAEIVFFHGVGVVAALLLPLSEIRRETVIFALFALSYLLYFLHEPWLLSVAYPFVISFYNMTILQTLRRLRGAKRIGVYMVAIGWLASGAGLLSALEHCIIYLPTIMALGAMLKPPVSFQLRSKS